MQLMQPNESNLPEILPALKVGIHIEKSGLDFNKTPTWLIHDKLCNKFYQVNWHAWQIISRWESISPKALIDKVNHDSQLQIAENDIEETLKFLASNSLIVQSYEKLRSLKKKAVPWQLWLAKNYLFLRIPLIKPNQFLQKTLPLVNWIFSKSFFFIMLGLLAWALILLTPKFDTFSHTFFDLFSANSLIIFAIALVIAKTGHELGHAYACKRKGLNIPTMGVAFLVLFPMLYTDTHESWKLKKAKDRVLIGLAGVRIEFYIAIIALWLWLITPNGIFKSTCFFLCTYSLLTTILINISPFLRFDGYFILSDLLAMRNLQTRSFSLAKWWMRKKLFGLTTEAPETFTTSKQKILLIYAFATWLYRFILFIGIAFLVYYFFFKVLGILLFVVEIYFFLFKPIWMEISMWLKLRKSMTLNKNLILSGSIFSILLLIFFIPFSKTIYLPAIASHPIQTYYTELPVKIESIHIKNKQIVDKGQLLIKLSSPNLDFQIEKIKLEIESLQWRVRNIGYYQNKKENINVLYSRLEDLNSKLKGFIVRKSDLEVKAKESGKISNLPKDFIPGVWLKRNTPIFSIIDENASIKVEALADYQQLQLINVNSKAEFIPDNINIPSIDVSISNLGEHALQNIQNNNKEHDIKKTAYLASTYGGQIPVVDHQGEIKPIENVYLLTLNTGNNSEKLIGIERGYVLINGKASSYFWECVKSLYSFIIKESAF